jgi:hypothetical protein
MAFIEDFGNLKADEQGRIDLAFQIPDPSGRFTPMKLSLKVTDRAIRRGRNLSFFEQSKYCGKCAFDGEMLSEMRAMFPDTEIAGAQTLVQEMTVQAADASAELSYVIHGKPKPSLPIGWAVMSPMIVTIGDDQYAPYFVPCDRTNQQLYCVDIMKNGVVISERLAMGQTLMPAQLVGELAYHPPLLFTDGQRLFVVYWVRAQNGRSIIQLLSLDPNASYPAPWTLLSTFENPHDELLSYLGGAMGPSGEIVIAGYGTAGPLKTHRLELMKIVPPYTGGWMPKQVIAEYPSPAYAPEYPHVTIRGDATISILAVLANYTPCMETGATYSAYKNVVNYVGQFGKTFVPMWSDATLDTVADPANHGDNCLFNAERYPLDHFWDEHSNSTYSIVRSGVLDAPDTNEKLASNARFIRTFKLYRDGLVIVPDLAAHFSKYFSNPQHPCSRPNSSCHVDSMSMTRLDNGYFVFFANNRGSDPRIEFSDIGVMWSMDLQSFSEPVHLSTSYGAGYGIKVAQPNRNGMRSVPKLHFFNTGNTYNAAELNHNHRFTYWRYALQ